MGLFDIFKSKKRNANVWESLKPEKYDMDTLEGINSIPVPAKDYHTGDYTKDCIYYLLQRKATEHKKLKEWSVLLHVCENLTNCPITKKDRSY